SSSTGRRRQDGRHPRLCLRTASVRRRAERRTCRTTAQGLGSGRRSWTSRPLITPLQNSVTGSHETPLQARNFVTCNGVIHQCPRSRSSAAHLSSPFLEAAAHTRAAALVAPVLVGEA